MPIKRFSFSEYEAASGLQKGQLWDCLSPGEKEHLTQLGYRPKCKLTQGMMDFLMEVFPVPGQTELLSFSRYEEKIGFGEGAMWDVLTEEQKNRLYELGYRKFRRMPYRVILYLKSLGLY